MIRRIIYLILITSSLGSCKPSTKFSEPDSINKESIYHNKLADQYDSCDSIMSKMNEYIIPDLYSINFDTMPIETKAKFKIVGVSDYDDLSVNRKIESYIDIECLEEATVVSNLSLFFNGKSLSNLLEIYSKLELDEAWIIHLNSNNGISISYVIMNNRIQNVKLYKNYIKYH